eukprot:5246469-Alexandrium_andersonii.AAC.1
MEKGASVESPAPMLVSTMSEAAGALEFGERSKSDLGWLLKFKKAKQDGAPLTVALAKETAGNAGPVLLKMVEFHKALKGLCS